LDRDEINDNGAVDADTGQPSPIVTTAHGPFGTKDDASRFADQFNAEFDGRAWRAVVRPMSWLKVTDAEEMT
jgi:hypothetical protein